MVVIALLPLIVIPDTDSESSIGESVTSSDSSNSVLNSAHVMKFLLQYGLKKKSYNILKSHN